MLFLFLFPPPFNMLTSRPLARPSPDKEGSFPDTEVLIPNVPSPPCNLTVSPSFHSTLARCVKRLGSERNPCLFNTLVGILINIGDCAIRALGVTSVTRGLRLHFLNHPHFQLGYLHASPRL